MTADDPTVQYAPLTAALGAAGVAHRITAGIGWNLEVPAAGATVTAPDRGERDPAWLVTFDRIGGAVLHLSTPADVADLERDLDGATMAYVHVGEQAPAAVTAVLMARLAHRGPPPQRVGELAQVLAKLAIDQDGPTTPATVWRGLAPEVRSGFRDRARWVLLQLGWEV